MTQEDKQLLLVDLCARLPYGVMLNIDYYDLQGDGKLKNRDVILSYGNIGYCSGNTNWVSVKPYLRPMSSMTEEEKEELIKNFWGSHTTKDTFEELSWYLSKHFDVNELIPKGLAIEAPEEMYNLNGNK